MPQPLTAPMPVGLDLDGGFQIQVTALDPSTGAMIAGVTVSNVVIEAGNMGDGAAEDLSSGPFMLVPGPSA